MIEADVTTEEARSTAPADVEKPEVPPARAALVKDWQEKVNKRRAEMEKTVFEQMRENQEIARRGAGKDWGKEKYTVPIITRVINQAVARLYAKNPTAVAKRKKKLMYQLWDGRSDSLQAAFQSVSMAVAPAVAGQVPAMPPDPHALALIQEVQEVQNYELMLDRMAKTMELMFAYYIDEQAYNYKAQIKAAVRRGKVCKVAYAKLGLQRLFEPKPEVMAEIEDVSAKIAEIECRLKEVAAGEIDGDDKRLEELRLNLQDLERDKDLIVREGPVFDFPKATTVIIDGDCTHLKSLAGARWIAFDYYMTPERVKEVYKVDIGKCFTERHRPDEKGDGKKATLALVSEIWDKKHQQMLVICDGYPDFMKEPATPDTRLERFWPLFPLVFNESEDEKQIFPQSDVENLKDIQAEYNRAREGRREHREAARPWWILAGQAKDEDEKKISNHAAHELVRLSGLTAGMKAQDLIIAGPTATIDPNLYETEQDFNDMMRVAGVQEAQIGATSGSTATESSIADASRSVSDADAVDDLDEWLTEIARATGQLMLMEVSKEKVLEIVGPGAVWPDLPQSRAEVAKDLFLEIKAGSSGRPNKAAELANVERAAPILIQLPGFPPEPLIRKYADLLEIDYEDAIAEGMPSITAINGLVTKAAAGAPGQETGDPSTNPSSQGGEGGQNAPNPQANEPGGQPSYKEPIPTAA